MHSTITLVAGLTALLLGGTAHGDGKPPTHQDLARIEAEQKAQRQLLQGLIQVLQRQIASQQAALDALQAAAQSAGSAGAAPAQDRGAPAEPKATDAERAATDGKRAKPARRATDNVGVVSGTVAIHGAKSAWVYVDDIQLPVEGTASMAQRSTSFAPSVLVVPKGTKVAFPNGDPIFHNVFSMTAGTSFDLGSYPQGESRTLTLTRTGPIDVYCNLHSQMRGNIFVVPNAMFVKVGSDGRFTLGNVPTGNRRIGVWAPGAAPVMKEVVVAAERAARLDFEITANPPAQHLRKDGTPYGSYDE